MSLTGSDSDSFLDILNDSLEESDIGSASDSDYVEKSDPNSPSTPFKNIVVQEQMSFLNSEYKGPFSRSQQMNVSCYRLLCELTRRGSSGPDATTNGQITHATIQGLNTDGQV
ncbi:hypothetical protein T4A_5826 [Trichinella pseudospiralis]|uniref:Uncharacterized protein n=1 Tax=Trichinella pseudospiralis TaxID=6337 RepID=A0A0V1DUF1_TRIPS|nr:hypothetical protein T4A_5826 [Trichinella pseudospiralis]